MPVPVCLGHDCARPILANGRGGGAWQLGPTQQEAKAERAEKTRPSDGLQQIMDALVKQQATVQEILKQQEELRRFTQKRDEALHIRLDEERARLHRELMQMAGGTPCGRKTAQPSSDDEEGEYDVGNVSMMIGAGSGTRKRVSTAERNADAEKPNNWRLLLKDTVKSGRFDMVMGVIILISIVVIFMQIEWEAHLTSYNLNLRDNDGGYEASKSAFFGLEVMFCIIFAVELLLRLWVHGLQYCMEFLNACDVVVVLVTCVDILVLTPLERLSGDTIARLMRVVRVLRVLRVLKVLRLMQKFQELKVILRTLSSSVTSVVWSMLLVAFMVVSSALCIVMLTQGFVHDEAAEMEQRQWVFEHYGSAWRASWTMLEATFTTAWPSKARPLITDVSPWFAIFWLLYVIVVNFTVIRVISALFLKQTLAIANLDAERQGVEKMKERGTFAEKIRQIFVHADSSGDGYLSRSEFDAMMEDAKVLELLDNLEIEAHEVTMLYTMLCDDDGTVDYEEFLTGALKMKNNARTLDIVQVLHQNLVLKKAIERLEVENQKWVKAIAMGLTGAASFELSPRAPSLNGQCSDEPAGS